MASFGSGWLYGQLRIRMALWPAPDPDPEKNDGHTRIRIVPPVLHTLTPACPCIHDYPPPTALACHPPRTLPPLPRLPQLRARLLVATLPPVLCLALCRAVAHGPAAPTGLELGPSGWQASTHCAHTARPRPAAASPSRQPTAAPRGAVTTTHAWLHLAARLVVGGGVGGHCRRH